MAEYAIMNRLIARCRALPAAGAFRALLADETGMAFYDALGVKPHASKIFYRASGEQLTRSAS